MGNDVFKDWLNSSYLTKNNLSYIDKIYEDFLNNPHTIDISWRNIFQKLFIEKKIGDSSTTIFTKNNTFIDLKNNSVTEDISLKKNVVNHSETIMKVSRLVNFYRTYGHYYAKLDPIGLNVNKHKNNFLELEYHNFTDLNIQELFDTTLFGMHLGSITLHNIYKFLKKTYCNTIGIEYMHILDDSKISWIQNYFESNTNTFNFTVKEEKQFLEEVIAGESFEHYLSIKFPGVKRFSLEGSEVLIPMLKEIIRYSVSQHGIQEIFFGMAHRGRLNVLANILGKNLKDIFNEFSNRNQNISRSGDVKYHQGLYSNIMINDRNIYLYLLPNPSHLEIINPIVMGTARSRIDQLLMKSQNKQYLKNIDFPILPIVIHGDAAISAQGVVQESFNMSNTHAYNVGGTIHIVINNQIGFTTSDVNQMRSTPHCTDIAKMIQAPVFHVNADDINSVIFVTRFALEFRKKFKHDILIDLVCYRRHGHNELDEPSVTQPKMYHKIRSHPTITKIYADFLNYKKIIDSNDVKNIKQLYLKSIEQENCLIKDWNPICTYPTYNFTKKITDQDNNKINLKKIENQYLKKLAYRINSIPNDIIIHDRVKKIYCDRIEMALEKRLFDWGGSETLAYATLLDQGYSIRLSGEDVSRGTFFHRHVIIYDQNTGIKYIPLMNISKQQGSFFIWDSVLSEESAIAFEYGYSSISNNTLVIWEAQFGDFANGAQVVIDQFISSSEQKWNQLCGLIMLLPHGYEGQGPEHSSCRIERYLQLCAEYNMQVCVPSTPAQIYHLLRQQVIKNIKKPLVIISPKSLLRHPMVVSSIQDLVHGSFHPIFEEIDKNCDLNKIIRVIICTGKIYYDLINQRLTLKKYNIAIIRIEQLYPFPYLEIKVVLQSYCHVKDFIWCQEEPKNQGAWYYIERCFYNNNLFLRNTLRCISRPDSAAPAVGYFSVHQKQQKKIIDDALDLN